GLIVKNATCPYVTNIQLKVKKCYEQGYKIIIVGDENHPEVIGINGWCNDSAIITNGKTELENIPAKVCVVSQTTEKKETWNKVLNEIVRASKEIVAFNTICSATDVRQKSVQELSKEADLVFVIGGKNSSNTTKLYEICKKECPKSYHIENVKELDESLLEDESVKTIGITAGASTPDWIINEVISKIKEL
ncbi:TPA: 4-hydroxy-3-methylbut-2-enyl diphosphate reductase, partial [Clostridium perfringens]|nr:4-hydroxy-3-methylbut-2-enyl diphosphate reductase [Clostridium perfringens]